MINFDKIFPDKYEIGKDLREAYKGKRPVNKTVSPMLILPTVELPFQFKTSRVYLDDETLKLYHLGLTVPIIIGDKEKRALLKNFTDAGFFEGKVKGEYVADLSGKIQEISEHFSVQVDRLHFFNPVMLGTLGEGNDVYGLDINLKANSGELIEKQDFKPLSVLHTFVKNEKKRLAKVYNEKLSSSSLSAEEIRDAVKYVPRKLLTERMKEEIEKASA